MPFFEINGVQLYYQVQGGGSPIVFTHGASWEHRQWRPQVEAFGQDFGEKAYQVQGVEGSV